MNRKIFDSIIKTQGSPVQETTEWRIFLEFCSTYLKAQKIKDPIVVELGTLYNRQKAFYEQLFGAEHIGIDISDKHGTPDILGDTRDPKVLAELMRRLRGRPIDILFIDASHRYEDVTEDFEAYSPLCSGLVVLHDTERFRNNRGKKSSQIWKFWNEIGLGTYEGAEEYKYYPLISIFKRRVRGRQRGIGIIVKG